MMSFVQVSTLFYGSHKKHCAMHFHIGLVVACCITDQETAEVILLNSLKEKPPDTKVTTLMTDDGKKGVMSHVPTIFSLVDNTG